jgi:alginate O-acetyltransferase complex protein AlgI
VNAPSYEFLAFAAVVAVAINLSRSVNWRRFVLLLANVAFILSFTLDPLQLLPFSALLAAGFLSAKVLEIRKERALFVALIIALVLSFCWLKRYSIIPSQLFLPYAYFTVGMSYVFFRVLHLVIESFDGTLATRIGPWSYVNYTLNFTSLISGPIQLYPDYERTERDRPASLNGTTAGRAVERIVTGFFKVAVLSPLLAYAQTRLLDALAAPAPFPYDILYAAGAVAMFPVYLYFNFSGYMDFVIGVARFLRLELPENFDRPFLSKGYIEFWGRWHMTLSNWLKTYVFSPLLLSLMRRYPAAEVEPFLGVGVYFVTFFLVGVWHGQTSMFLVFGALQGLGVSANKLYQIVMLRWLRRPGYRALCGQPVYASLSRGLTYTWYAISLLWFWSTWGELSSVVSHLGAIRSVLTVVLVLLGAVVALSALDMLTEQWSVLQNGATRAAGSRYLRVAWCAALLTITVSITLVLNAPAPHIVYRAF